MTLVRIVAGWALCGLAVVLLVAGLSHRINLVGPLVLVTAGVWLIVGPRKILQDQRQRRDKFRRYVATHPDARKNYFASKRYGLIGVAIIVFAVTWMYVSPRLLGNGNWLLSFGIGGASALVGIMLVAYSNFSTGIVRLNAAESDRTSPDV